MGSKMARLADVQCSRMKYDPDDRIMVTLRQPGMTAAEKIRIRKMVEKFTRCEVMVVDPFIFTVEVEKAEDRGLLLE